MNIRCAIYGLVLCIGCSNALAEPNVLYDSGETIGIEAIDSGLLDPIRVPSSEHSVPSSSDASDSNNGETQSPLKKDATLVLPLEVAGLSVARVQKKSANFPQLESPICIIGADDRSLSWLVKYYDQLTRLKAKCLLVQVSDQQQLARVAQYAGDIPVMPDVGGISKSLFKILHYPVLISNNWIEQ